ncbi:hypothetical protein F5Y05DRAFT_78086 [Hypoxylon sp. FL0543]|nr:hypothetical protein F5Y05DRAFT_78086 [Hypoxylon sp. FL0543]
MTLPMISLGLCFPWVRHSAHNHATRSETRNRVGLRFSRKLAKQSGLWITDTGFVHTTHSGKIRGEIVPTVFQLEITYRTS